jgi:hypothetical protein
MAGRTEFTIAIDGITLSALQRQRVTAAVSAGGAV